jgi:hypothetical protein
MRKSGVPGGGEPAPAIAFDDTRTRKLRPRARQQLSVVVDHKLSRRTGLLLNRPDRVREFVPPRL